MMTMNKIILNLFVLALLLISCQKDSDIFIPNTTSVGLDTNWVAAVTDVSPVSEVKRLLKKENLVDSVDASVGGTFQTSDGLNVMVLPQSLLLPSGLPATGRIYIETIIVKQKGDMVRVDKPTTSFGRILVSAGEIFIRIRKENVELQLAPGKTVYLKYNDNNPTSLMRLFYGDESNSERFNSIPSTVSSSAALGPSPQGYDLVSDKLRWINLAYFADSSGARINVAASLPADYTNANTSVYLVYKEIKSVVGMYGDQTSKKFASPKVPIGKAAVIVSITKKGPNSYYLGHETITTGQTNLNGIQTVPLKPQPTSLADIKAYLNTL